MEGNKISTKNLAVMFTDIKGFTERTAVQTREQHQELHYEHDRLLIPVFKEYKGILRQKIGDAFLVTFESSTDAVLAGVKIQSVLKEYNTTKDEKGKIEVRVAINSGDVSIKNNDIFGETISLASRMESYAEANEILFSHSVYLSMNKEEVPFIEVGEHTFRGIPEEIKLYKVVDPEEPSIPLDLADAIRDDQCVCFIGDKLFMADDIIAGKSIREKIAGILASNCDFKDRQASFEQIAQFYEMEKGRENLIKYIVGELQNPELVPPISYKLIARLPFKVVVTTNYDSLLEKEYNETDKEFIRVLHHESPSEHVQSIILLVKLFGSIEEESSLVLTERDYWDFLTKLPTISDLLKAYFSTKTLLFLGFDMEDDNFRRMFQEITRFGIKSRHKSYIIQWKPSRFIRRLWGEYDANIVYADTTEFLKQLDRMFQDVSIHQKTVPPDPSTATASKEYKPPYKYLSYYEESDSDIFFGRRKNIRDVANKIQSNRFLILFGQSGAGKTSFVNAGLIPDLKDKGLYSVYLRFWHKPFQDLLSALNKKDSGTTEIMPEHLIDSTIKVLDDRAHHYQSPIVIFMDQFEDLFLEGNEDSADQVIDFIEKVIKDKKIPCCIIISIREDYFGRLIYLRERLHANYNQEYRLKPLNQTGAKEAIKAPLDALNIDFEASLLKKILDDLSNDRDEIFPPHLQIVCQRLYEHVDSESPFISLYLYNKLGGAETIISDYLDDALFHLEEGARTSARQVLKLLVSSEGKRTFHSLKDIQDAIPDLPEDILEKLQNLRLVKQFLRDGGLWFELSHDYMAEKISNWISEEEFEIRKAYELLNREWENWSQFQSIMNRERLLFIEEYIDQLEISEEKQAFLAMTAYYHKHNEEDWAKRLSNDDYIFELLNNLLNSEKIEFRIAGAHGFKYCRHENTKKILLNLILEDNDSEIRDQASISLAILDKAYFFKELNDISSHKRGVAAQRALWAITTIMIDLDIHNYQFGGMWQREKIISLIYKRIKEKSIAYKTLLLRRGSAGGFVGGIISCILVMFLLTDVGSIFARLLNPYHRTVIDFVTLIIFLSLLGGTLGLFFGYLATYGMCYGIVGLEVLKTLSLARKGHKATSSLYAAFLSPALSVILPFVLFGALLSVIPFIYTYTIYYKALGVITFKGLVLNFITAVSAGAILSLPISTFIGIVFGLIGYKLPQRLKENIVFKITMGIFLCDFIIVIYILVFGILGGVMYPEIRLLIRNIFGLIDFASPISREILTKLYKSTGGVITYLIVTSITTFGILFNALRSEKEID